MYEINLVPDVKAELLNKQKLRNLVILVCVAAGVACVVVILVLVGIVGTQAIMLANQDGEIKCRSTGEGDCKDKGTAVQKYDNLEILLTMKSQMQQLNQLSNERTNLSRIFPLFDVILPEGEDSGTVNVSMIDVDFESMNFNIIANSTNSVGFRAREAFAKGLEYAYYDYGSYMRTDDQGNYVAIPSFCIDEKTVNGILYGVYRKGDRGCEAPINTPAKSSKITYVPIRRTYENEQDLSDYKEGKDKFKKKNKVDTVKGYYFQSECIQYNNGEFSEQLTLGKCGLLEDAVSLESGSYGRGDNSQMVLNFTANFKIKKDAFLDKNKHMIFVGPTKRNVTDSYVPVREIFSEDIKVVEEVKNGK
jgi:hypothetical protein